MTRIDLTPAPAELERAEGSGVLAGLKSGIKTTEFWLAAAAVGTGFLLSTGLVADGSLGERILGGAMTVLSALGYGAARSSVKKGR